MTNTLDYSWTWSADPLSLTLQLRGNDLRWEFNDDSGRDRNDAYGRTEIHRESLDEFWHAGPWPFAFRSAPLDTIRACIDGLAIATGRPTPPWIGTFELIQAARANDAARIGALLDAGKPPDQLLGETDALGDACRFWKLDAALTLIAAGAALNRTYAAFLDDRRTPLLWAVEHARLHPAAVALLDALIAAGADIEQPNPKGETPLHFAAQIDAPPFAATQSLLAAGANPNAFNRANQPYVFEHLKQGWPPLYAVSLRSDLKPADRTQLNTLLKNAGADLALMPRPNKSK